MSSAPTIEKTGSVLLNIDSPDWVRLERSYRCQVLLSPEPEGGFSVEAVSLPGAVSEGETVEETLSNIREALQGAIGQYLADGDPIPWTDRELERPEGSIELWVLVSVEEMDTRE